LDSGNFLCAPFPQQVSGGALKQENQNSHAETQRFGIGYNLQKFMKNLRSSALICGQKKSN
ncbi:MAG: hypothetical protein ACI9UA_003204, partial [Pseudoalteromonas tetraodonis]